MASDLTAITPESPVRDLWPADPAECGNAGTRAINRLKREGIATAGELAARTPAEVTAIRGAGEKVLAEVRRALAAAGMSLKDDDGATSAEVYLRVRRLTDAGLARPAAVRFARQSWPKGNIGPGITVEVSE